jgi:hypothetical protein
MASGMMDLVCRIGGVIMPWVMIKSYELGAYGPFLAIATISVVSTIATYLLPLDMADRRLDQDDQGSEYEPIPQHEPVAQDEKIYGHREN